MIGRIYKGHEVPAERKDDTEFRKHANGYLYVIEAAGIIKVGKSIDPKSRVASHRGEGAKYNRAISRFWISPAHGNYEDNERQLIKALAEVATPANGGREYFTGDDLTFSEARRIASSLEFNYLPPEEQEKRAHEDWQKMQAFVAAHGLEESDPFTDESRIANGLRKAVSVLLADQPTLTSAYRVRDEQQLDQLWDEIYEHMSERYHKIARVLQAADNEEALSCGNS